MTPTVHHDRSSPAPTGHRRRRLLIGLGIGTGRAAVVGGALLVIPPGDGDDVRSERTRHRLRRVAW